MVVLKALKTFSQVATRLTGPFVVMPTACQLGRPPNCQALNFIGSFVRNFHIGFDHDYECH